MSHLHLVDGLVSPVWWVTGFAAALLVLMFAISRIKKDEVSKRVPYIGVISALMLLTMSIPLGFLPFHLNLTIVAGILAGPWLGFVAVFIVNLMLALMGHGGITVVGLNTLIIGSEVILGYYLFNALRKQIRPVTAVAAAVVISLLLSTSLMVGLITITEAGIVNALPHSEEGDHEKVVSGAGEANVQPQISPDRELSNGRDLHGEEELEEHLSELRIFSISGWGAIGLILGLGVAIEALVASMVISYFLKVKPDLVIPEPVINETGENPFS